MSEFEMQTTDFVRELRLRNWARQNYVTAELRKPAWHPVVLDEMSRRDTELLNEAIVTERNETSIPNQCEILSEIIPDRPEQPSILNSPVIQVYATNSGSKIVPLIPGSDWTIHSASSDIPRPHFPTSVDDDPTSAKSKDLAMYY